MLLLICLAQALCSSPLSYICTRRRGEIPSSCPATDGFTHPMAWIEVVIADADDALAVTDFQLHNTPWPELQHLLALITGSAEAVADCIAKTQARQGWERQIEVLELAARALKKQEAMADHFPWHYLGEVK